MATYTEHANILMHRVPYTHIVHKAIELPNVSSIKQLEPDRLSVHALRFKLLLNDKLAIAVCTLTWRLV